MIATDINKISSLISHDRYSGRFDKLGRNQPSMCENIGHHFYDPTLVRYTSRAGLSRAIFCFYFTLTQMLIKKSVSVSLSYRYLAEISSTYYTIYVHSLIEWPYDSEMQQPSVQTSTYS